MHEIGEIAPEEAESAFALLFGENPEVIASAPGRVNLIGEHTDYNEGFVLPVAIDRRTYAAFSRRSDDRFIFRSETTGETVELRLDDLERHRHRGWSSYVAGVASLLRSHGIPLPGLHCRIHSDIPMGSGLSSSAALELAAAMGLLALAGRTLPVDRTIRLCQQAEWDWAGVSCGIMDQFISARGVTNTALKIDCRSLDFEYVPLDPSLRLIICDTNVPHRLTSSEYNKRRDECSRAVKHLSLPGETLRSLRDVSAGRLEKEGKILDDLSRRRARHVIRESERVLEAADALWYREHATLGSLLNDSHESLRTDYEVSCRELDIMAEICRTVDGVWGARMVGAGFGGSVLALATPDAVTELTMRVEAEYYERTAIRPTVLECRTGDGAKAVRL